jgi:hypothetical protein
MSIVKANMLVNMIGIIIKNQLGLRNRHDVVVCVLSIIFIYKIQFSFQHRHKQGLTSRRRGNYDIYFVFEKSLVQISIRKHKPD